MHPADLVRAWRARAAELGEYAPEAARVFAKAAEELEAALGPQPVRDPAPPAVIEMTWRERLWIAPPTTRLGRDELLEALGGKSRSWLYERTSDKAPIDKRIPHRKDAVTGELVFIVGEVRDWLRGNEVVIVPGSLARREVAA